MKAGTHHDRLFDKRVVRRNIREGRVTKEEYQAFLQSLPDRADHIKPRDEGGDDDGYDARSQPRAAAARPVGAAPAPAAGEPASHDADALGASGPTSPEPVAPAPVSEDEPAPGGDPHV